MLREPRAPSAFDRAERRAESRTSYPRLSCLQTWQAERDTPPGRSQWVRCHDLGARGISYWTNEPPAGEHVLLSIEDSDSAQLVASVRHVTSVNCVRESLYLVGCQVIGTTDAKDA